MNKLLLCCSMSDACFLLVQWFRLVVLERSFILSWNESRLCQSLKLSIRLFGRRLRKCDNNALSLDRLVSRIDWDIHRIFMVEDIIGRYRTHEFGTQDPTLSFLAHRAMSFLLLFLLSHTLRCHTSSSYLVTYVYEASTYIRCLF